MPWLFPDLLQLHLPELLQQRQKARREKGTSLAEQATKSPLPSWRLPAYGRGGKRAGEDEK